MMTVGNEETERAFEAYRLGVRAYLPKPPDGEDVTITVGAAVECRRLGVLDREFREATGQRDWKRRDKLKADRECSLMRLLDIITPRDDETIAHAGLLSLYCERLAKGLGC